MESLCKADGWTSGPPPVRIYWGDTNQLFKKHEFVVTKAPYEMRTFTKNKTAVRAATLFPTDPTLTSANIIAKRNTTQPYHLWPVHATQTLTLKRITNHQLTHAEIREY
jgi:hypothetical protein